MSEGKKNIKTTEEKIVDKSDDKKDDSTKKAKNEKVNSEKVVQKQNTEKSKEVDDKKAVSVSNDKKQEPQPSTVNNGTSNEPPKQDSSNSGSSNEPSKQESNTSNNSTSGNTETNQPAKQPVWHEPVYEQRWVVDQTAWDETISEPVYSTVERAVCNQCGADITGFALDYITGDGDCSGYHSDWQQIQTGTNTHTVHHDEVGHYEQVVTKEGYWA